MNFCTRGRLMYKRLRQRVLADHTAFINVWKIFPGYTGDWFDVKTASTCTTELWDALKSFILDSLKIKVAPHPIIVSLDTLIKSLPKFQLRVDRCSCLFKCVLIPLAVPKFSPYQNGEFSLYRKLYATEIKVDYKYTHTHKCTGICMRERERERERGGGLNFFSICKN